MGKIAALDQEDRIRLKKNFVKDVPTFGEPNFAGKNVAMPGIDIAVRTGPAPELIAADPPIIQNDHTVVQ
ncbi:MAG: hypothetical protein WDO13_02175 [Verrucomicrobiota bacterium]